MKSSELMQTIVYKAPPRNKPLSHVKVLFLEGSDPPRVHETRPVLGFFRQLDAYVVNTRNVEKFSFDLDPVGAAAGDGGLSLRVTCNIHCAAERAKQALLALVGHPRTPGEIVVQKIREAFRAFLAEREDRRDEVTGFFDLKPKWEEFMAERFRRDTGLDGRFTLDAGAAKCEAFRPEPAAIAVCSKDGIDGLRVVLDYTLNVDPLRRREAMLSLRRLDGLEEEVRTMVTEWVAVNCTAEDFCRNSAVVREALRARLEKTAAEMGRTLGVYKADCRTDFEIPPLVPVDHKHPCTIRHFHGSVQVAHKAMLCVDDIAKWRLSGVADLEAWLRPRLEQVTQQTLFSKNYVEIVTTFGRGKDGRESLEEVIRDAVVAAVREVGCKVEHFSSVPDTVDSRLADPGFDPVVIEDEFTTRHDLKVKLRIRFQGKLDDFDKVSSYIGTDKDIVEMMTKAARHSAQKELLRTTPEEFYIRFQGTDTSADDFDVEVVPDLGHEREMPTDGVSLVVLGVCRGQLLVRIFDESQDVIVDAREADFPSQQAAIAGIKTQIDNLGGVSPVPRGIARRLVASVLSVVGPMLERSSVEQRITRRVADDLKRDFHATCEVSATPLRNSLVRRYLALLNASPEPFDVQVLSKVGEPVPYRASFKVRRLHENGWVRFQTSHPEEPADGDGAPRRDGEPYPVEKDLEAIRTTITHVIQQMLNFRFTEEELIYHSQAILGAVRGGFVDEDTGRRWSGVRAEVADEHGFDIKLTVFQRKSTEDEDAVKQLRDLRRQHALRTEHDRYAHKEEVDQLRREQNVEMLRALGREDIANAAEPGSDTESAEERRTLRERIEKEAREGVQSPDLPGKSSLNPPDAVKGAGLTRIKILEEGEPRQRRLQGPPSDD